MKALGVWFISGSLVLAVGAAATVALRSRTAPAAILPDNWRVSPAGDQTDLPGDLPAHIAVLGNELLVSTNGFHDQSLNRVDITSGQVIQTVELGKTWTGMCISPDKQTIYLSGGGSQFLRALKDPKSGISAKALAAQQFPILRLHRDATGELSWGEGLDIDGLSKKDRWISGLACDNAGDLFAANLQTDTIYKFGPDDKIAATAKVGYRPYDIILSPDGKTLAVSNWGSRSVTLLKAGDLQSEKTIEGVGDHPCEMKWDSASNRLFVACAGGDTVAVLDPTEGVKENIRVTPDPTGSRVGVTPCSLALSSDGERLYVADAGTNCVCVVDTSRIDHSRILGFIPTGWYPSAVAVSPGDRMLFVGVGKGLASRANSPAQFAYSPPQPDGSGKFDYIGSCLSGALSMVKLPDANGLAAYTKQVVGNIPNPNHVSGSEDAAIVADGQKALKNIRHVVYIIRENRTYDQVFGDLSEGNGDSSLTIFGSHVTPNAHKLVQDGVLLDNFYCDGEVSEDGHEWCNAAYATDFKERAWENTYSGRAEPEADERLNESPAGYLWDNCRKHGKTYRSYGEYSSFKSSPDAPPIFTGDAGLKGHGSLAWSKIGDVFGHRDFERAQVFIDDLHAAEKTGNWPQFMVMSLGEDHTQALAPKAFTPVAHVASNDDALGMMVDAISHSRFWKDTAILVLEDDAQNGPDHVDCHRSVALVISPYARRQCVDHTHYSTSSFVHTIELILGLPTMTEFDSKATPLWRAFTSAPDLVAYDAEPEQVDMEARNPERGLGAKLSASMDFSGYDRADPDEVNALLYESLRPGEPVPAPVHSFGE